MTLCGEKYRMPAERAYQLGLVDELVPPDKLMETADEIAHQIAANSPAAVHAVDAGRVEPVEMPLHARRSSTAGRCCGCTGTTPTSRKVRGRSPRSAIRCGTTGEAAGAGGRADVVRPFLLAPRRRRSARRSWRSSPPTPTCVRSSPTRASTTSTSGGCTASSASATGCRWPGRSRRAGAGCRRCTSSSSGTRWPTPAPPARRSGRASSPRRSSPTAPTSRRSASCPGLRRGHDVLLARLLRARGRLRPRRAAHAGGARRRRVRAQRREALDVGGHRADYLWVLCRTGTIESHGRGLTLLIVDRRSPGITISPIPSLDGERFNEVRFDDVEVPVENRVGEEDGAWTLMVESLATERHVQFSPEAGAARLRGARRPASRAPASTAIRWCATTSPISPSRSPRSRRSRW